MPVRHGRTWSKRRTNPTTRGRQRKPCFAGVFATFAAAASKTSDKTVWLADHAHNDVVGIGRVLLSVGRWKVSPARTSAAGDDLVGSGIKHNNHVDLTQKTHAGVDEIQVDARIGLHAAGVRNVLETIADQPHARRVPPDPQAKAGLINEVESGTAQRHRFVCEENAPAGFRKKTDWARADGQEVPAHV